TCTLASRRGPSLTPASRRYAPCSGPPTPPTCISAPPAMGADGTTSPFHSRSMSRMRVRSRPLPSVLARLLPVVLAVSLLAAACLPATPEVVKIGLVAPFEGRYREIGSDVIPAVRLAIHEWAALNSGRGGRALAFELVSYDDEGDPLQAVEQARKLASDPDVEIVIGHWLDSTSQAALPVYTAADLRLIT